MSFLYPSFLAALSLIAIPIIIHLFNFRRYKTVYFTNVRFLREIKEETTSRSRLKHLLVLFSRILAISFIVLAFAQPYIPLGDAATPAEGRRKVSVYVDNSFSMAAEAEDESLLNRAKRKATEVAQAYGEEDQYQLMTNDFEAKHQRFVTRAEFLAMLDEVSLSPQTRTLKEVQAMQMRAFEDGNGSRIAYWLSDFQKNMVDFQPDSSVKLSLVPLQAVRQNNVYIDSSWMEGPAVHTGQASGLLVRIRNSGDEAIENSRLSLTVNGQTKAISDFSVSPQSDVTDTINFSIQEDGWLQMELFITDYPITFDDRYFMALKVSGRVDVLVINEDKENPYLNALYSHTDQFKLDNQSVTQLNYASLGNYSLIILNDLSRIPSGLTYELQEYLAKGGAIAVFPNAKADLASYNEFAGSLVLNSWVGIDDALQAVTYLNEAHELFFGVFEEVPENLLLPQARLRYTFTKSTRSTEQRLLGFRDGSSFVSQYTYKGGNIFTCASPLAKDYTDFPTHALFVPMLYKMALSGGRAGVLAYTLGNEDGIEVESPERGEEAVLKIRGEQTEFIPEQRAAGASVLVYPGPQLSKAGVYSIVGGEKDELLKMAAFNYDRKESILDYHTDTDLKEQFEGKNLKVLEQVEGDFGELIRTLDKGIPLWKFCIILALVFVGAEVLLLRFLP